MLGVPAPTTSSSSSADSTTATCGAAALRSRRSLMLVSVYRSMPEGSATTDYKKGVQGVLA